MPPHLPNRPGVERNEGIKNSKKKHFQGRKERKKEDEDFFKHINEGKKYNTRKIPTYLCMYG